MSASVIAHYKGTNRFGDERRALIPLPADVKASNTIEHNGMRLELVKIETAPQSEYFNLAIAITNVALAAHASKVQR